jgi:hypothetical protein
MQEWGHNLAVDKTGNRTNTQNRSDVRTCGMDTTANIPFTAVAKTGSDSVDTRSFCGVQTAVAWIPQVVGIYGLFEKGQMERTLISNKARYWEIFGTL